MIGDGGSSRVSGIAGKSRDCSSTPSVECVVLFMGDIGLKGISGLEIAWRTLGTVKRERLSMVKIV